MPDHIPGVVRPYGYGVVYAPDVPPEDRLLLLEPAASDRKRHRHLAALEGRVIPEGELRYVRSTGGRADESAWNSVWRAVRRAWASAQPLAGVLDLDDLARQLDAETWICAQLLRELSRLERLSYRTTPAEETLLAQLDARVAELDQLTERHEELFAEHGTNPLSTSDDVARALALADALDADRPARDTTLLVAHLHTLLDRLRNGQG